MKWMVTAAFLAACSKTPKTEPTPQAPEAKPTPGSSAPPTATTFDGLSVGGTFDGTRAPYDKRCDSDPLDGESNIRVMFYTGKECRNRQFPDGTSVVILVDSTTSNISAFAWVGGTYFDSRNAPLKTGTPLADAVKAWGEPAAKFDLQTMRVARFANGTRALSNRNGQVIGFAFGDWPDANGPRWNPVDQVNGRYTAPIPNGTVSAADCQAAMAHVYELMGTKDPVAQMDIDDCLANSSPETIKCLTAAKDKAAIASCYPSSGR